jgi:hypothetical protein
MTYLPINEKILALIETLKPENKDINEFLEEILSKLKEKKELQQLQTKKMQELWEKIKTHQSSM